MQHLRIRPQMLHRKHLQKLLNPLDATLTKNRGGGGLPPSHSPLLPHPRHLRPPRRTAGSIPAKQPPADCSSYASTLLRVLRTDPRLCAHASQWSKTDAAPPASPGKAPCAGFPSLRPARLSAIPQIQPGEPRSESARPAAGPSAPAARKRNRETKQAPIAPGGLSSAARNCKEEENVEPLSLPTQPRRAFHALRKCTRHTSVPATSLALARSIVPRSAAPADSPRFPVSSSYSPHTLPSGRPSKASPRHLQGNM